MDHADAHNDGVPGGAHGVLGVPDCLPGGVLGVPGGVPGVHGWWW